MKRWSTSRRPLRVLLAVAAVSALVAVPTVASAVPSNPAADVPAGSAHADGIAWALGTGVSIGCTSTTFCPGDPLTRGQAATMMMRLADAVAATGPQGETGPAGPAGATGPAGPTADVDALTAQNAALAAQVEDLEAEVAGMRYGGATVVTSIEGATTVRLSSPVAGAQECAAPGCQYLTFAGHSVSADLRQQGSVPFEYRCGEDQPLQASVFGGADGAHLGSCHWHLSAGGIPAGTTTITVASVDV